MPKIISTHFEQGENGSRRSEGHVLSHLGDINLGFLEKELSTKATQMKLAYVNLQLFPINPDALRLLSPAQAEEARAIPFFLIGKEIRLAVLDPKQAQGIIKFLMEQGFHVTIALMSQQSYMFGLGLYALHRIEEKVVKTYSLEETQQEYEKELEKLQTLQKNLDTLSDEDSIDGIIYGALRMHASDIHLQPESGQVQLRFRIDGVLHTIFTFPSAIYDKILMRMKYRAAMKMNVSKLPQDGKFLFMLDDREIDLRMSCLPTEFGETIVLRLLDAKKGIVSFKALGFVGLTLHHLEMALKGRAGMVLVTGPTGSGKTTTLYSVLDRLNGPEVKVITLEDPVEYHLPGISQSQIHEDEGYTFASGLRSILRQDPDVIMVGEIRDLATAETAVQAALTGHMMLSTVHTNSAIETIPRLLNMGVKPYLLAPSLNAVIAQRLVRTLCPHCKTTKTVDSAEKKLFSGTIEILKKRYGEIFTMDIPKEIYVANGCSVCNNTGYTGQIGVMEVLIMSDGLRDLILAQAPSRAIYEKALLEGMITMKEDGLLKVMQGLTTLEEVVRVAGG